jgi:hypothetical protein
VTFFKVVLVCLLIIGAVDLGKALVELSLRSEVYACTADKDVMPTEVQRQCKRLTRGQWWNN